MTQIYFTTTINSECFKDKDISGIYFNGTVGFMAGTTHGKKTVLLCPLKEKTEAGYHIDGVDIDPDGEPFALMFETDKSIDVLIDVLQKLKEGK